VQTLSVERKPVETIPAKRAIALIVSYKHSSYALETKQPSPLCGKTLMKAKFRHQNLPKTHVYLFGKVSPFGDAHPEADGPWEPVTIISGKLQLLAGAFQNRD
jgi:hypothetical protein